MKGRLSRALWVLSRPREGASPPEGIRPVRADPACPPQREQVDGFPLEVRPGYRRSDPVSQEGAVSFWGMFPPPPLEP